MMISEVMAAKLNTQVKEEFNSYWIYLGMSYALYNMNLRGYAKWFEEQAGEEQKHGMKIAKYLVEQGAKVKLGALESPKSEYASVEEIAKGSLDHEIKITKLIHELMDLAGKENDHATASFLSWFVDEQVEEVAIATQLLQLVKLTKEPGQLLMLEGRIFELRKD